jgi:hypothetical protein
MYKGFVASDKIKSGSIADVAIPVPKIYPCEALSFLPGPVAAFSFSFIYGTNLLWLAFLREMTLGTKEGPGCMKGSINFHITQVVIYYNDSSAIIRTLSIFITALCVIEMQRYS